MVLYTILLLIVTGGAVLGVTRVLAARRRRAFAVQDDSIDRPAYDIPLLFAPRPDVQPADDPPEPPLVIRRSAPAPQALQTASSSGSFDGTMQLLPGRLEPLTNGLEQEIRFVKLPGINRFTFGRSPGPAFEHVQLRARTASRMHAYMLYEDGRWRLGNLSETNRVLVNGAPIPADLADHLLKDGDQIEFGEVAFIFRER